MAKLQAQPNPVIRVADPLSLQQADQMLLQGNRAIRVARQAVRVANSEIDRVNVLPNPTVNASLANTTARQYRFGATNRNIGIEQLVERGGKRELRADLARKALMAVHADLADIIRQQRVAMIAAYYDLVASQRNVGIADENAQAFERLESALELRVRTGDAAAVDLARLRVESTRAANAARKAREAVAEAQVTLANLLGAESSARALVAGDSFPALSNEKFELDEAQVMRRIDEALVARADVRAATARIAAYEKGLELAISQRTRDVTIGLYTERDPDYGGNVFGVSATIPLFVNNDFGGDIARAKAELDQAREDLERIRGLIRSQIDHARVQLESARDRAIRYDSKALPEAQRAADAIEFAFARGAASLTDLFDARRQLALVRAEAVINQADFAKAFSAFEQALQIKEIQ